MKGKTRFNTVVLLNNRLIEKKKHLHGHIKRKEGMLIIDGFLALLIRLR